MLCGIGEWFGCALTGSMCSFHDVFVLKDLKPSNLAVNEDCELKVKDH